MGLCIDCEWNRENKLLLLSWYKNPLEYGVLKGNEVTKEFLDWVLTQKLLIGHNIKTDLWIIAYNTGILLDMPIFDTFIAAEFKTKGINNKDNSLKRIIKTFRNRSK
ncbi:MAG: hypothetical protein HC917_24940 [Richelia sp. SM2_1_7]|nr:hypothetical protein [Richelia sp. SM2_1_7]